MLPSFSFEWINGMWKQHYYTLHLQAGIEEVIVYIIFNGSLCTENLGAIMGTQRLSKVTEKPKQIRDIIHEL